RQNAEPSAEGCEPRQLLLERSRGRGCRRDGRQRDSRGTRHNHGHRCVRELRVGAPLPGRVDVTFDAEHPSWIELPIVASLTAENPAIHAPRCRVGVPRRRQDRSEVIVTCASPAIAAVETCIEACPRINRRHNRWRLERHVGGKRAGGQNRCNRNSKQTPPHYGLRGKREKNWTSPEQNYAPAAPRSCHGKATLTGNS